MNKLIIICAFVSYTRIRANPCPTGTEYDGSTGTCLNTLNVPHIERYVVPARDITCPSGTTYDSGTGECRRKDPANNPQHYIKPKGLSRRTTCAYGYTYVPSLVKCRKVIYVSPIKKAIQPSYTCPNGFTYESSINRCRRDTQVDPKIVQLVKNNCPLGFYYVPSINKCRRYEQGHNWRCPWLTPHKTNATNVQGRILGKIFPQMRVN